MYQVVTCIISVLLTYVCNNLLHVYGILYITLHYDYSLDIEYIKYMRIILATRGYIGYKEWPLTLWYRVLYICVCAHARVLSRRCLADHQPPYRRRPATSFADRPLATRK